MEIRSAAIIIVANICALKMRIHLAQSIVQTFLLVLVGLGTNVIVTEYLMLILNLTLKRTEVKLTGSP
jgi:hypothetical protein